MSGVVNYLSLFLSGDRILFAVSSNGESLRFVICTVYSQSGFDHRRQQLCVLGAAAIFPLFLSLPSLPFLLLSRLSLLSPLPLVPYLYYVCGVLPPDLSLI